METTIERASQPTSAERRLQELAIKLPVPPEPFGAYAEAVQVGSLLFLSGMLPTKDVQRNLSGRWEQSLIPQRAATLRDSRR